MRRCCVMDKFVITEKLVSSYQMPFGKDTVTINEYSASLTKEEYEAKEMMIKAILAKVFSRNE
jgi:hypothetical protein